jgi:hypothetical protein
VLSQLDILVCHKLVFDDDLKAVLKRMPAQMPKEYSKPAFIKSLPIGYCLVGDRSDDTSRVFALSVRPRFSQHEGRETRSVKFEQAITPEEVRNAMIKMALKQIEDRKRLHTMQLNQMIRTISSRYNVEIPADDVVNTLLKEHNCIVDGDYLMFASDFERQKRMDEVEKAEVEKELWEKAPKTAEEILAFRAKVQRKEAEAIARKNMGKKFLFIFGRSEFLKSIDMFYSPIWRVEYDRYEGKGFKRSVCFVDGMSGEILAAGKDGIHSTRGASKFQRLNRTRARIITMGYSF